MSDALFSAAAPLTLDDFNYALPPELIAQSPSAQRGGSRLLHLDAAGAVHDRQFVGIDQCLRPGDLLVFNDTKVVPARLAARKTSGGAVEILVERFEHLTAAHAPSHATLFEADALIRSSKSPQPGTRLQLADGDTVEVLARDEAGHYRLGFTRPVLDILHALGSIPLPPYIDRNAEPDDQTRYQTVYARHPGAVAAPTAGLHFDTERLAALQQQGIAQTFVTLHVGAGTFLPVRHNDLSQHRMHAEWFDLSDSAAQAMADTRQRGGRIVAVGTTSVRCLESAWQAAFAANPSVAASTPLHGQRGDTRLFITPGYRFQTIDALITNFHLPRSTLLMLVSAFAGLQPIRRAYAHAIAARYRFFSYGDAMFIDAPAVVAD